MVPSRRGGGTLRERPTARSDPAVRDAQSLRPASVGPFSLGSAVITLATNPCGRQPLGADDYFNAVRKGDMFLSQLVGPTLGRVAILDARGRSPHVRSGRPPIVGPRGRGSLPRLPAVGDGVRRSRLLPPEILKPVRTP